MLAGGGYPGRVCAGNQALRGRGCPPAPKPLGHCAPAIYHEARLHGGHQRQLAAIPHAELLQLPRTEPAGGRKEEGEAKETRQRRGSTGRAGGGALAVFLGEIGEPNPLYPFLFSRPEEWYVCVWGECQTPGPKGPPCKWLKPPSQKPQLWTRPPPLHLNKALFHHPGASAPLPSSATLPSPLPSSATLPSPQGRPLLVIHQLQPGAPLCGNHRA